jgi:DNA-directed RNA polymerase
MINNISSVPFKINLELLEYIQLNNEKHGFLINANIPHKYENISKRTVIQESEYKAHNSKIVLEQTILDIVEFYKNYSNIYFPVRSDQRGRLYCMPHYFNYQGNDLSKALILFTEPGYINKQDMVSINYLKLYGANCYGLSKKSNEDKIK